MNTLGVYTQDFNSLGNMEQHLGADGHLLSIDPGLEGWYLRESGSAANTTILPNTGHNSVGDSYHFGNTSLAERAIGSIRSTVLQTEFGFFFKNNSTQPITRLVISYKGEQWRLGTLNRLDRLNFSYSLDASTLTNGHWIPFPPLDFVSPVTTGSTGPLDGNLEVNRLELTDTLIGIRINPGEKCFLRWSDFDASGSEDGLAIDDISIQPVSSAAASGYFRTCASGNWNSRECWSYSTDSLVWLPATDIPDAQAGSIVIRAGDTIFFRGFAQLDELIIENGGVLDHQLGLLTLNDGPGMDCMIRGGGLLILSSPSNAPIMENQAVELIIDSMAILRINASGLTTLPGAGIHSVNYRYNHSSILEYALSTPFGTNGITYFPNAQPQQVPVFRTLLPIALPVGSSASFRVNGVFEPMASISFNGTGEKIFRNGINGIGNITATASGRFVIDGATAELGGVGNLVLPPNGLDIGPGVTVDLISPKKITGNIQLKGPASTIQLNDHWLTVDGSISNAEFTSYVRTNGNGMLQLDNIGDTEKKFPIGNEHYNGLLISSAAGAAIAARVLPADNQLTIPSVRRLWQLQSTVPVAGSSVTFHYNEADIGPGLTMDNALDVLLHTGAWNQLPSNTGLMPNQYLPGRFMLSSFPHSIPIAVVARDYALARAGGLPLSSGATVFLQGSRRGGIYTLNWDCSIANAQSSLRLEKSLDGKVFQNLFVSDLDKSQKFNYLDTVNPLANAFYRVLVCSATDTIWSPTVFLKAQAEPARITLLPNPASDAIKLIFDMPLRSQQALLNIRDLLGQLIIQKKIFLMRGKNVVNLEVSSLRPGPYQLSINVPQLPVAASRLMKL